MRIISKSRLRDYWQKHPDAEAQWLRSAIRASRRERQLQQPPKHTRELYHRLYSHLENRYLENELRDRTAGQ